MQQTTSNNLETTRGEIVQLIEKLNQQETSRSHGFCLIEAAFAAPRLWYADPLGGSVVPFPGAEQTYESILACLRRIESGGEVSRFRQTLLRSEIDTYNDMTGAKYVMVAGDDQMAIVDLDGSADHLALATRNHRVARLWWRLLSATQKS